jgi:nucleoside-diphosphate-sugar epimerase
MQLLVSGGAGFIGSHLVRGLLAGGHEVVVLDNFFTGRRENLDEVACDVELIDGDIRDLERTRRATRACEAVFHLAAVPSVPRSIADPITTHETNATGTLNVLIAARDAGAQRVVFASSSSIYGATKELPKRESRAALPISPYAVSKLAGESYCRSFFEVFGLETVALRYFNVFGPRQDPGSQYAAVVPRFIRAFLNGEAPTIFGDGEQSRDFTYVGNVVEANLAALARPGISGRVYNIACGERTTLNELATILRQETGAAAAAVHGPPRAGEVRHSLADISLARRELGYEPAISLTEGLRRTIEETAAIPSTNGHRRGSIRPQGNETAASPAQWTGVDVG